MSRFLARAEDDTRVKRQTQPERPGKKAARVSPRPGPILVNRTAIAGHPRRAPRPLFQLDQKYVVAAAISLTGVSPQGAGLAIRRKVGVEEVVLPVLRNP